MNAKKLITLSAAMLLALTGTSLANKPAGDDTWKGNSLIVPPHANYAGKSYAEWLAAAEEWRFSITGTWEDAPEMDADGSSSGLNQQGPVFFLQYSWTLDPHHPVPDDRYANVRAGQAILADLDGWFSIAPTIYPLADLESELRAWSGLWTEYLTLIIDGVEVPINGTMESPYFSHAAFQIAVPENSATMNLIGGPAAAGTYNMAVDEWIALIKPLPVGEHLIQIKGGNPGTADPVGTDQNIWWNWVNWHITVIP